MKKLFSTLLSLVLVLSMGSVAFADDLVPVPTDVTKVDLTKVYKILTDGIANPAETFNFTLEKDSVSDSVYTLADMPVPTPATLAISFTEGQATLTGATGTNELTLPEYKHVGIFTYKITETPGTTAGVVYDNNPLFLKVTVIEQNGKVRVAALHYTTIDGKKTDKITNTYNAGSLEISKKVTGNLGDQDKYFDFTVTLFAPTGKTVHSTIGISGGSNPTPANPTSIVVGAPTVFRLKSDDKITFSNIPYGVTYSVSENTPADYTLTVVKSNDLIDSALDTVAFTNNKTISVDTGIALDSIPYILLLAGTILGMGVLLLRKRRKASF